MDDIRKNLPCSQCGELMWRSSTSAAEGQATCRPCRRRIRETKAPRVYETWRCGYCDVVSERPRSKGQRPKWCEACRTKAVWQRKPRTCERCGEDFVGVGRRFCSHHCASEHTRKPTDEAVVLRLPTDRRSELRQGYEDNDPDLFFAALVSKADTSTGSCWVWPRLHRGYPQIHLGQRNAPLHRIVLEMKHGAILGSQHAHHICANAACVNPDHLQPVTHRDNIAEMLARQSYLSRIAELEAALAIVTPDHPLLQVIRVS